MSLKDFENHLKIPSPGFRCAPVTPGGYVIKVKHQLGKPATKSEVAMLRKMLGKCKDRTIAQFYAKHNGGLLYRQIGFNAAGLRFYPIRQWTAATRHWLSRRSGDNLDDWGNPRPLPRAGIVFAEIPRSGNFFFLRTEGKQSGFVFYDNHEDATERPLAKSFELFLDMVWPDPAAFLYERGGYTRYSDRKTATQWIPRKYISDVRKQTWIC
jgi:hypothetical protein